jgi:hypothetical protein
VGTLAVILALSLVRAALALALALGTAAAATVVLGSWRLGSNPGPHAGFTTNAAEETRLWLLDDLELRILVVHTELIESKILGFLD